jgi:predicted enzyme related to lactoylglutathione lyase
MQNPFVWHDLMTTDVEGAKTFYQKVIGWNYSSKHSGCHTALVGDHGVGGIIEIPEHLKGMPPFWYGYVYTPDVEAACKQVVEYGGKVLRQPWDIEGTEAPWGIFHAAGEGAASWFDVARAVLCASGPVAGSASGFSVALEPIPSSEYAGRSERLSNSMLDCSRLQHLFAVKLPPWQTGVHECVERLLTPRVQAPEVRADG